MRNERLPSLTMRYETFPSLEHLYLYILKSKFMLSILIRWLLVPGHKGTLVDTLLNVFSKEHKESLKNLNAHEAGRQSLSSWEWIQWRKHVWELAFLYVHEAALWLEGWFYHSEFSGYYLLFNHIGYFGIGFYFFSLNGEL